jgi:predicted amidophosphoribosyltransferase
MRNKLTQAQTGLTIGERKLNIKNAFHIQRDFSANSVAIFDDVVTTGSTINELCKVLNSYGIKHIQIWCCARTTLK